MGHTQLKAKGEQLTAVSEKTILDRMAGKQGQKQLFEASWERIDSTRNPDLYEAREGVTLLRGQEVTENSSSSSMESSSMMQMPTGRIDLSSSFFFSKINT